MALPKGHIVEGLEGKHKKPTKLLRKHAFIHDYYYTTSKRYHKSEMVIFCIYNKLLYKVLKYLYTFVC